MFNLLVLALIIEYMRLSSYLPFIGALKINTILPLIVFLYALRYNESLTNGELFRLGSTKWLLFYFALILFSFLTASVTLYTFDYMKVFLGYFFLYISVVKLVDTRTQLKVVFAVMVFVHVAIIILNPDILLDPGTRSYISNSTFMGDGNDFAWSLCIVIPFAVYLLTTETYKLRRVILTVTCLLLVLSVIGTSSRGATLALTGSFFYLWSQSKKKVKGIMALFVVVAVVVIYAPPTYFERMETIKTHEQEGSAAARIRAWKAAISMANADPLTGAGAGHFAVRYGSDYYEPGLGRPEMNAHSVYFKLLGELGYPGLLFIIGILWYNYRENRRSAAELVSVENDDYKIFHYMNASLISYAIAGAFLSGITYPHIFMIAALNEVVRRNFGERKVIAEDVDTAEHQSA